MHARTGDGRNGVGADQAVREADDVELIDVSECAME
jgi:hypothetical protein